MSDLISDAGAQSHKIQRAFQVELERLEHRLQSEILPFWAEKGFDRQHGLFQERFDFAGIADEAAPRRAMVQARQIYVFSHAVIAGLMPDGRDLVERGLDTLLSRFDHGSGGFAFSVTGSGETGISRRESYTQAFVLFALAWAFRLTADRRIRPVVETTIRFVERALMDQAYGGLHEKQPMVSPRKSQNPQMHFLEALLVLHEVYPDGSFLDRAHKVVALFLEKILRRAPTFVPEFAAVDWHDHPDKSSRFFEPGHHFEWIWLLEWYRRLGGRIDADVQLELWETASLYGVTNRGRVLDEIAFDLQPRRRAYRLWPHAEAVKAAVIKWDHGDGRAAALAFGTLETLQRLFLGRPFAAGWVDRVDENGTALVDNVPASSLYHLYGAWAEARRKLGS